MRKRLNKAFFIILQRTRYHGGYIISCWEKSSSPKSRKSAESATCVHTATTETPSRPARPINGIINTIHSHHWHDIDDLHACLCSPHLISGALNTVSATHPRSRDPISGAQPRRRPSTTALRPHQRQYASPTVTPATMARPPSTIDLPLATRPAYYKKRVCRSRAGAYAAATERLRDAVPTRLPSRHRYSSNRGAS